MTDILTLGAGGMSSAFDGVKVPFSECDVRDINSVSATLRTYRPSTIILTAGVSHPSPMNSALFEDEIHTNVIGAFNVAQMSILYHVQTMIFIASVAGLHGKPGHASYSASKAAVISLVQSLGHEGHAAFAVSPGRVDTPMRERDYPSDQLGSRLDPDDIWKVIRKILDGQFAPGSNVLIRKVGLTNIVEQVVPTPWREKLRVGEPVNI